ncbi:MAG TPA: 2-oxoacid:acceptor oxidoreductase subunit alpha, partial [Casimicrobiaceae bacterium]|nr:2-oxoacid:acceptor oxidoreductase subunit alpha [Casimicrobiaceae bacterium]
MRPLERINDFVVKFANVNGSGSASANSLFAKAVLRMGVPVAARNIFPSNIQGMPTWYEVRVVEQGWRGRRGGVDLAVAMNPETWNADVAELEPGGYLLYDSTRPLTAGRMREDVVLLGVPLTGLCHDMFSDPRQRQLFKNVMYVGALAALLHIEPEVVEALLASQYAGERKAPLLDANRAAFRAGYDHVAANLPAIGLRMERRDRVGDRIFVDGNSAAGLGAVYGGATVCAWYPITPSTSLAEAFKRYCTKLRVDPDTGRHRFAIVQAEDELASIGMVVGAGWNGARAFTATSGPGISLMQEFIGLAYFAEIPAVLFDVQRGSPSTGMPTKTQQADVLCAAYASHGDTKHVLLFPEDPTECFSMGAQAFDLADRLQTPVFVMLDLDIGMQDWLTGPFKWDDQRALDRGKVMSAEELEAGRDFGRYLDVDGDGIPYRTLPGVSPKGAFFTRGSGHAKTGAYTEDAHEYQEVVDRLGRKFETAKALVP